MTPARWTVPLAMLATLAAVGCAAHVRQPEAPTGPAVRIMTYNINYGGYHADLSVEAIREANADIVCLQETSPQWETYLRAELGAMYPHMVFRHSYGAGGQAFLSKCKLEQVEYMESHAGWFPAWIVVADTAIGRVQILNVHLRPPLSEKGSVTVSSYLGTGGIRLAEIEQFAARLRPGLPTVVCGDFNESDSGGAVEWLVKRGMTDSLREFDRRTNTWAWQTSVMTLRNRYDHVLYTKDLYCYSSRVIKAGASDHFPVVALFGSARAESGK